MQYRRRHPNPQTLPSTLVVPHRYGRFGEEELRAIARVAASTGHSSRIVGIRDLDWDYAERPANSPDTREGENWKLVTLQCKEIENLFCDPHVLGVALGNRIPATDLERLVEEESKEEQLVAEWRNQVRPRIRQRLSACLDESSKEREADAIFGKWQADDMLRCRLVSGKRLLKRLRERVKGEYNTSLALPYIINSIDALPGGLLDIIGAIFPGSTGARPTVTT